MARVRPAIVAGSFYPAEPHELRQSLRECFTSHRLGPQGKRIPSSALLGGVVPHAGYTYSGPCAAHFYSCLSLDAPCVVLLGVNHRGGGARAALSPLDHWETPLGKVRVDRDLARELKHRSDLLEEDEEPHLREHSIEVQLPFLQSIFSDFSFLPLSLSYLSDRECEDLGLSVARVYEAATAVGKKTVIVASSDLSHYLSPEETERLDRMVLDPVLALDPAGLLRTVEEKNISMCGVIPTAVLLFAAKALGAKQPRLLMHCHSGDVVPMREVVGYASVAVEL